MGHHTQEKWRSTSGQDRSPWSLPAHSGSAVQASLPRRPPTSSPPARHSYRLHGLIGEQILGGARRRSFPPRDEGVIDLWAQRAGSVALWVLFCSSTACFTRINRRAIAHHSLSLNQLLLCPSPIIFFHFWPQKASFGAFWMLFLQLNCKNSTQNARKLAFWAEK